MIAYTSPTETRDLALLIQQRVLEPIQAILLDNQQKQENVLMILEQKLIDQENRHSDLVKHLTATMHHYLEEKMQHIIQTVVDETEARRADAVAHLSTYHKRKWVGPRMAGVGRLAAAAGTQAHDGDLPERDAGCQHVARDCRGPTRPYRTDAGCGGFFLHGRRGLCRGALAHIVNVSFVRYVVYLSYAKHRVRVASETVVQCS